MKDLVIDFKPERFSKKENLIQKAGLYLQRIITNLTRNVLSKQKQPPEEFCKKGCS